MYNRYKKKACNKIDSKKTKYIVSALLSPITLSSVNLPSKRRPTNKIDLGMAIPINRFQAIVKENEISKMM
jgi:hypothetical protein